MESILPEPEILLDPPERPEIPLPKGWTEHTLLAVLHVIALARIVVLNVANWPIDSECDGLRLRCENDRLRSEIEMLKREIEIKDARFSRIDPKKRPIYNATERFEILAIKAMRGWSNEQMAKRFHVTVQTMINWMNGVESGEDSKVAFPSRPNRYPDFVRYIIQQFKAICPMLGRHKIAEILCRVGLHLSASTVKRCIDEPPVQPTSLPEPDEPKSPKIEAWYANHVWLIDLTVVPSTDGLWTPWSPNALSQVHPYSWYVMVVIDHFSRRIMGFEVFEQNPTASQVASTVERICTANDVKPKYLISDQGTQFVATEFRTWCKTNEIKQRFGAIGRHGSIAVTERAILTFKDGYTRRISRSDFTK